VVSDLDNFGFAPVTKGIQDAAAAMGYLVVLVDRRSFSGAQRILARLIQEHRVDGMLLSFALIDDELVSEIAKYGVPAVTVNRRTHGIAASVTVDDETGSRMAIEHLTQLGHRAIGYIAGTDGTDTAIRRERGVVGALSDAGLQFDDRWVQDGAFSLEGGRSAMRAIIASSNGDLPTAIYGANLVSTLGALEALLEAGVRVPDDVSLIAMDDHEVAAFTSPPLTTVAMPLVEMGYESVRLLHRLIHQRGAHPIMIPRRPAIVTRSSTGPPRDMQATRITVGARIGAHHRNRFRGGPAGLSD
jgi:DNA-binding LacI/PurR family transcriptional regulator